MAHKVKFFHPPHLYYVTTLPSKTNTTANIGVKCLHFSRNVMVSVGVSYGEDKGGFHRSWSES